MKAIQEATAEEAKQRLAEKAAKKAAFNAEYDVGEISFAYHRNERRDYITAMPAPREQHCLRLSSSV